MTKTELRKQAKAARAELDMDAISAGIVGQLERWSVFQDTRHCLLFYPLAQEIDVQKLIQSHPDKTYYLPRIGEGDALTFHVYQEGQALQPNQYSIPEPLAEAAPYDGSAGLLIVPALMVDGAGYRLGYGKSYYDRFLAGQGSVALTTAAVIPEALTVATLPTDEWDVPVEWVITETRIKLTGNPRVRS